MGEWSRVEGHSSDPNPNDPYGIYCICDVFKCVFIYLQCICVLYL